jgi:hypothetical protein
MRAKALLLAALLAFLASGVCLGQSKKKEAKPPTPLVRMDLLQKKEGEIAVVKRDIFAAQSSVPTTVPAPAPPAVAMRPGVRPIPLPGVPGAKPAEDASEEVSLSLRYVGYIQGGRKYLALVLFENQALAVEEGELVGEVWKVVRVDAGEIEVRGLADKIYTFALEGERK